MSEIKMQILDTPTGERFNQQVASYTRYMSKDVLRFPELIEKIKKTQKIETEYLENYSVFMRWGIRKLEYSFVFDNLQMDNNLHILDVGSGVTILPHILSKMGYRVDALDPDLNWELADAEIGNLYNSFYNSEVNYINNCVYLIQEKEIYDRIISVSALEHLAKKELGKTLNRMISLLKPGGRLLLTIDYCPRVTLYLELIDFLRKLFRLLRQPLTIKDEQTHKDFKLEFSLEKNEDRLVRLLRYLKNKIKPKRLKEGFSYNDFRKMIYPHIPGSGNLLQLKKQDKEATACKEFWESHAFEGCLYQGYRHYLSLGICWIKPL